eukprot:CAMPEP_0205816864 /NCGR_PEP_ID=MMETSP0205-20121125/23372_1 /ASSEMBLY_ACC=CAM_ASM_000278 /TAXON_ID=36767 /ORGANISM="Euplotes focardii, Strain TN1" /LENGTH=73 /DNA_ID=CAMNT_0053106077 /DNA_START=147 /DNA_END=365 /DNA_ORIENTATION=+
MTKDKYTKLMKEKERVDEEMKKLMLTEENQEEEQDDKEIILTSSPRFESTYNKSDEKFFKSGNENIFYDTKRG